MLDKEVVVVGYSGHGIVVASAALKGGLNLKYYTELNERNLNPFGLKFLGSEAEEDFIGWTKNYSFILGVGDNYLRNKITNLILSHKKDILNVIHPHISVSDTVKIGLGNFIALNVSIPPLVVIGNYNILNTGCIVDHECQIGNFVHIGPGAVLAGNVEVGDFSFIGANSVIKQGVKIGKNVVIGAGSVILHDVEDNITLVGNPGRKI